MTDKTTTPAPAENIYAALAAAQAEFKPIAKNCVNPAFRSKYADLQSILDATRPVLNRHGLFLFQRVASSKDGVSVETCVTHSSGGTLSSGVLFIPVVNPKNPAQAFGSAETYARRYSLSAFLGVNADEDDDGNGVHAEMDEQTKLQKRLASALVDVATEAANHGTAAYKEFYEYLTPAARKALNAAGIHSELKVVAESVDEKLQAPQAIQQAAAAEIETKPEE